MTAGGGDRAGWIAALPMYDLAPLGAMTDAWWTGIAGHLRAAGLTDAPDRLDRTSDLAAIWGTPELLFGQGCGYPFIRSYRTRWQVIATPCYAAEGCEGPTYRSRILVREEAPASGLGELVGAVAAINDPNSHSGHIALRAAMAPHVPAGARAFRDAVPTGSHVASLRAVAAGTADVCAVDAVTYALLARHAPDRIAGLRTLSFSASAPALPYIAGSAVDADILERLRDGLFAALQDPKLAEPRDSLLIAGAEILSQDAYARIHALAREGEPAAFL